MWLWQTAILSGESAERHLLQSNPDASKVHSVGAVSQKCEALGAEMSGAWVEVVQLWPYAQDGSTPMITAMLTAKTCQNHDFFGVL